MLCTLEIKIDSGINSMHINTHGNNEIRVKKLLSVCEVIRTCRILDLYFYHSKIQCRNDSTSSCEMSDRLETLISKNLEFIYQSHLYNAREMYDKINVSYSASHRRI